MNLRRRLVLPLSVVCGAVAASCGPNDQAQTVSFQLAPTSKRLTEIEFVVHYQSGKFASTDGQCVVSSAAGPRSFHVAESELLAKDLKRTRSRDESGQVVVLGGDNTTTTVTSSTETSSTTTTTTPLPTTTLVPTTTLPAPTTTVIPPTTTTFDTEDCGDGVVDEGEECDDDNQTSNDGCDGNCRLEFLFTASDNEEAGELTIHIRNALGIPAGATLAFCKFQGDVQAAEITVPTTSCSLVGSGTCNPTTDGKVGISTTTTTTTTTKSTTSTTNGNVDTTTSSTLEE